LSELFLSREAEVNASLAAIYGVKAPAQGWATVTLPAGERAGLLTRVGFLAAHAHSGNGSPPLRGSYVMQRLFCQPVEPPPPNADTSPPPATGTAFTNREQFEERTAPTACRGCHSMLNSFGFGLEHYDAMGRWRADENGLPVDASGELIDSTGDAIAFDGAPELTAILAGEQEVRECFVEQWFTFAHGRAPEVGDTCSIDALRTSFDDAGQDIPTLLIELTRTPSFRYRPAG
jgi:hypothetical protein